MYICNDVCVYVHTKSTFYFSHGVCSDSLNCATVYAYFAMCIFKMYSRAKHASNGHHVLDVCDVEWLLSSLKQVRMHTQHAHVWGCLQAGNPSNKFHAFICIHNSEHACMFWVYAMLFPLRSEEVNQTFIQGLWVHSCFAFRVYTYCASYLDLCAACSWKMIAHADFDNCISLRYACVLMFVLMFLCMCVSLYVCRMIAHADVNSCSALRYRFLYHLLVRAYVCVHMLVCKYIQVCTSVYMYIRICSQVHAASKQSHFFTVSNFILPFS